MKNNNNYIRFYESCFYALTADNNPYEYRDDENTIENNLYVILGFCKIVQKEIKLGRERERESVRLA